MICSCKTQFVCTPEAACWCKDLPRISVDSQSNCCLCPTCLQRAQAAKANGQASSLSGIQKAAIRNLGIPKTLEEGVDFTYEQIDGQATMVFTSWYLLRRGYCCDNGCRNCPYKP